jgi:hypothetical protein
MCATLLLKSHLKRSGFETLMVNYIDSENEDRELGRVRDFDPQIVLLSSTFVLSAAHLSTAAETMRRHLPNAFVLAGGHHVFTTLMYLDDDSKVDYLQKTGLDAFIE